MAVAIATLCVLAGCSHSTVADVRAHMTVNQGPALEDTTVDLEVSGLPAGSTATVSAQATDSQHVQWTSSASFHVPSNGVVTLDQLSVSGSYIGRNPLGLLLFMKPAANAPSDDDYFSIASDGFTVQFTASVSGRTVATGRTERVLHAPGTKIRFLSLASDGIYGYLFTPPHQTGRHPAVLAFGGSEGGLHNAFDTAGELAARGYPTLALAYFKEPGLPQNLSDIPLEYFAHALRILRAQPDVDPNHVNVFGVSRGGEAALLISSTYPSLVNGVIAGVPSSQINVSYPAGSGYAWTLHGKRLQPGTPIRVENIDGPILDGCATDDEVWDSCKYVDQITARLHAHHFAHPLTVLRFLAAGHLAGELFCCNSDTLGAFDGSGGTVAANAAAAVTGHRALLRFLTKQ